MVARTAAKAAGADCLVRIECGNALEFDLSAANKVFLFLTDRGLRILLPRLQRMALDRAAARGGVLQVCTFLYRFKDVQPVRKHRVCHPDLPSHTAYPLHLYHFDGTAASAADAAAGCSFGAGAGANCASSSTPGAPDMELQEIAIPQILPPAQLHAFLRRGRQAAFLRLFANMCMEIDDAQASKSKKGR